VPRDAARCQPRDASLQRPRSPRMMHRLHSCR
jgi:hypothetical protein